MNEIIENKKKSEILAEKIATLNYGDIITHKQIADVIKEEIPKYKVFFNYSESKKDSLETVRKDY